MRTRTLPLGKLLTFQRGHDITKKEQTPGPYPVISSGGSSSTHVEYRYEGPGVIIGRKGTLGTVHWSDGPYWPHDTTLWVKDFKENEPRYLYYLLQTLELERFDAGASNPTLNRNHLHLLEVVALEPGDQATQVAALVAFDDLIENNRRRIEILEEMARLLYREWFVHFRFPGYEDVEMVDSELGPIPEGWELSCFGDLLEHDIGGGWGQEQPTEDESDIAYVIRGTDIPGARRLDVSKCPARFHKPSGLTRRVLKEGDLIIEVSGGSKGQPVGRSMLVSRGLLEAFDHAVICASFCKLARPDQNRIKPILLSLHMSDAYDNGQLDQHQVQSTGITNFKWKPFLSGHLLANPPMEVQHNFEESVGPLRHLSDNLGAQNSVLREARDLLLPRLVSGELDVSELDLDGMLG